MSELLAQDPMVPPQDRCRYNVDKKPSGPFDRQQLLDYLENKAKEDKDWDEAKPYSKETRGAWGQDTDSWFFSLKKIF